MKAVHKSLLSFVRECEENYDIKCIYVGNKLFNLADVELFGCMMFPYYSNEEDKIVEFATTVSHDDPVTFHLVSNPL